MITDSWRRSAGTSVASPRHRAAAWPAHADGRSQPCVRKIQTQAAKTALLCLRLDHLVSRRRVALMLTSQS